jgi:predicted transcriptional regulator
VKRPQAGGSALIDCPRCGGSGHVHVVDGEQIRRWRKAAKLSLRTVASLAGCSVMYLSDIEGGRRTPAPDNPLVARLVQALLRRQPLPPRTQAFG